LRVVILREDAGSRLSRAFVPDRGDIQGQPGRDIEAVDASGAGADLVAAVKDQCHVGDVGVVDRYRTLSRLQVFGIQRAKNEFGRLAAEADHLQPRGSGAAHGSHQVVAAVVGDLGVESLVQELLEDVVGSNIECLHGFHPIQWRFRTHVPYTQGEICRSTVTGSA
jgi:hypothetical protein